MNSREVRGLRDAIADLTILINDPGVSEEVFHKFFLSHPEFVFRNEFTRIWSKPRLVIPEQLTADFLEKYIEPDLILGGRGVHDPFAIVEIKLPNVPIIVDASRRVSAHVTSGLSQLRRYRGYLQQAATRPEQGRIFGAELLLGKCMLLIGRMPDEANQRRKLFKAREDTALDVQMLTYDEILEFQKQRLRDKMKM